jgi:hypothetical protein
MECTQGHVLEVEVQICCLQEGSSHNLIRSTYFSSFYEGKYDEEEEEENERIMRAVLQAVCTVYTTALHIYV